MVPGDLLYLYTDGVTEAFNIHNQLYGEERLENYLQTHLAHPIEEVVKESIRDVIEFSSGMPQSDDITLLVLMGQRIARLKQPDHNTVPRSES